MATPTPTLAEKLDKIKSPGLQSQQKVKEHKRERRVLVISVTDFVCAI